MPIAQGPIAISFVQRRPKIEGKITVPQLVMYGLSYLLCFFHPLQSCRKLLHMNRFLAFTIEDMDNLSLAQDTHALGTGKRIFFYLAIE